MKPMNIFHLMLPEHMLEKKHQFGVSTIFNKMEDIMLTVYKYQITIEGDFTISLPYNYRILKVGCVNNVPFIWALVNTENEKIDIKFVIYGTGHEIVPIPGYDLKHIETFKQYSGELIWHLFKLEQSYNTTTSHDMGGSY
jgi:hypothetical protein